MAKFMKKGGSKKLGYFDLGGNFVDMSSQYQSMEPASSYGSMGTEEFKKPPGAKHAASIRKRQQKGTRKAIRNIGKCSRGRGPC